MIIHRDGWRYSGRVPAFFTGQANCYCCSSSVTGIYIYGGADGSNNPVGNTDRYVVASDTWPFYFPFPPVGTFTKNAGTSVSLKCYSFCGTSSGGSAQRSTYELTPASGAAWSSKTDCPTPAREHHGAFSDGTYSYICGGNDPGTGGIKDIDRYSPDTWTSMTDTTDGQDNTYACFSQSHGIVVGRKRTGGGAATDNVALAYNVGSDTWAVKTSLPSPNRLQFPQCDISGKVYCAGGTDGASYYRDNDEYDLSGDSWTSKTDIPTPGRSSFTFTTFGSAGYAAMGDNASGDMDSYTPDTWTSKTSIGSSNNYRKYASGIA